MKDKKWVQVIKILCLGISYSLLWTIDFRLVVAIFFFGAYLIIFINQNE